MIDAVTTGATDVAPATSTTTLTGTPATNPTTWRDTLPQDLRDNPSLRTINDVPSLAKSYVHAQSLVGADKIVMPKDNAPTEEWDSFWNKVGRPSNPEGYGLGRPENFPEGAFDKDMHDHMLKVFHETGMTSKQAKNLYGKYMEYIGSRMQQGQVQQQQQTAATMERLKTEYGPDFNVRVAAAQKALQKFGSPELVGYLEKSGLGNNPELIKLFSNVGLGMSESSADAGGNSGFGGVTPMQAQAELSQLRMDKDFIQLLTNKSGTGHREASKKWQHLHAMAFPADE
jgi:hypothetical protein